jgi:hypothetical protein
MVECRPGRAVPRPRDRPLPPVDELLAELEAAGVTDAPREGPEDQLQAMLFAAAELAVRHKRISFADHSWDDPRFAAIDDKVRIDVALATLQHDDVTNVLLANASRVAPPGLLLLDARSSPLREFELEHRIYGEVTLSSFPHKPQMPKDPRVAAAREAGWGQTLKHHNLLPGRGIVVRDEQHGAFLHEPALSRLAGVLVVHRSDEMLLWWNPFCVGLDSELQYWLQWGRGSAAASEWRELLRVDEDVER